MKYILPINYEELHCTERRAVLKQYIKEQNNLCMYCGTLLTGPPASKLWLRRNYDLVKQELEATMDFTRDRICDKDEFENFEYYFFSVFMDCLHPYYYEETNFNYKEFQSTLTDMFYVECTEFYFNGREKC